MNNDVLGQGKQLNKRKHPKTNISLITAEPWTDDLKNSLIPTQAAFCNEESYIFMDVQGQIFHWGEGAHFSLKSFFWGGRRGHKTVYYFLYKDVGKILMKMTIRNHIFQIKHLLPFSLHFERILYQYTPNSYSVVHFPKDEAPYSATKRLTIL